ncbi:hypothetical protein D3C71_1301310 [compost metagenome]
MIQLNLLGNRLGSEQDGTEIDALRRLRYRPVEGELLLMPGGIGIGPVKLADLSFGSPYGVIVERLLEQV